MEVSYLKTPAEIYNGAAKVEIVGSRRLDTVARRHEPTLENFPSWLPDWSNNGGASEHLYMDDIRQPKPNFHASGSGKADF